MTVVIVIVTAKPGASQRTRNRLREHPGIWVLKQTSNPVCFGGREAHLLEHPDGWTGWLPADEVDIKGLFNPLTTATLFALKSVEETQPD